jgi:hypothetical protein
MNVSAELLLSLLLSLLLHRAPPRLLITFIWSVKDCFVHIEEHGHIRSEAADDGGIGLKREEGRTLEAGKRPLRGPFRRSSTNNSITLHYCSHVPQFTNMVVV